MTKRLLLSLLMLLILRGGLLYAQDPMFTQFYASPLQLNPAFAGSAMAPFVALNYRMQYPSQTGTGAAYSTFAASYDQHFSGLNSGIGISLMTDDAGQGILRKTYASVHYSYKVESKNGISTRLGIEGGFIQNNLDWDKLIFPDQLDPIEGPTFLDGTKRPTTETRPLANTRTNFDISMGLVVYGAGFHGGFVAKHLTTPEESFFGTERNLTLGLPVRWTLHGGYEFILQKATRYKPATFISPTLMAVKQGPFAQVIGGAYLGMGAIVSGFWYRHAYTTPESIIFMVGFKQDYFKVGYSYDYTVGGQLSGRTGGSHEISLTLNLDPGAAKRVDMSNCFKMFR